MILLREKLVKILSEFYDECPEVLNIPETADKIITLFVDSINTNPDHSFPLPWR